MYYFMLGILPLPIPPKALEIKTPSMNKTITLINDGEINIPKKEGLREISFEFLLPTFQKYPFAMYRIGDYTAATIILYLKLWMKLRIPMPFIVVRMSPKGKFMYFTSILCLIEEFTYTEDAEEYGFDTNCSMRLKEYNPYGTKRVEYDKSKKTATVQNERSTADRQKKSEIKPKEGETPISAAKREGYNPSEVFGYNGITPFDPSVLSGTMEVQADLTVGAPITSQTTTVNIFEGVTTPAIDAIQSTAPLQAPASAASSAGSGATIMSMPAEAGGLPGFVLDAYSGIPSF